MSDPSPAGLAATVIGRTCALAGIPAPTGAEGRRGEVVAGWWTDDGWSEVRTDPTGNVWARVRSGDGPAIVLCAHLDTVFPADLPHGARLEGDRLIGPSVGDDSVAVAALSSAAALLGRQTTGPARKPGQKPIWILATVGEEGLGNLAGIRGALDAPPQAFGCLIAVEGNYLGRVSHTGAGSLRWRVRVEGPGGHAWEASSAPSAVHSVASMVAELATLSVEGARTSVNIGRIEGGEAINARARSAWFDLDMRSEEPDALVALERMARDQVERHVSTQLRVDVEELGRRPAGGIHRSHPLVVAAADALSAAGIAPSFPTTSTDANAAHDRAIPAIAVGITTGSGEHTPSEWIDIAPIAAGVAVLAATVERFEGSAG